MFPETFNNDSEMVAPAHLEEARQAVQRRPETRPQRLRVVLSHGPQQPPQHLILRHWAASRLRSSSHATAAAAARLLHRQRPLSRPKHKRQ